MPIQNLRVVVGESNKLERKPFVSTLFAASTNPVDDLAADELLVELYLRPIHPADLAAVSLSYPGFQPLSFPAVPGLEGEPRSLECTIL